MCLSLAYPVLVHSQYFSHLNRFKSWLGQTEQKPNRSPLIDSMNKYVGNPYGSPYCAASVCYAIRNGVFRTGLATALRNNSSYSAFDVVRGKRAVQKGDIVVWQKGSTVFGHAGLVASNWDGVRGETYEGNTSGNERGSQSNGDGFYKKQRTIQPTVYFRIKFFTPVN